MRKALISIALLLAVVCMSKEEMMWSISDIASSDFTCGQKVEWIQEVVDMQPTWQDVIDKWNCYQAKQCSWTDFLQVYQEYEKCQS